MPQFRVLVTSFIDNKLVQEGDVVDYDGIPHTNLEPLDKPGKTAAAKASQADIDALARQKAAAAGAEPDAAETAAKVSAAAKAAGEAIQQSAGADLV